MHMYTGLYNYIIYNMILLNFSEHDEILFFEAVWFIKKYSNGTLNIINSIIIIIS